MRLLIKMQSVNSKDGDYMKEKRNILPLVPLCICTFLPLLTLILHLFGYSISLANYEVFSAVSAVICIASVYLIKESDYNKSTRVLIAFMPLIQLINTAVYVYKSKSFFSAVFMAVCFVLCAVISEKILLSDKAKIASVITSSLMFIVIVLISFITVFFGDFSVNTVVKTVDSPDGEYFAEIVDYDKGAFGGDTLVYVKKADSLNLFILKIEKNSELIYMGEWKEYETMDIHWKDKNCLIINSKEYSINQ